MILPLTLHTRQKFAAVLKENLNGSCENMNQFPPKRQHNPRVLKDSQYSTLPDGSCLIATLSAKA
jgi:hypothetical protein